MLMSFLYAIEEDVELHSSILRRGLQIMGQIMSNCTLFTFIGYIPLIPAALGGYRKAIFLILRFLGDL